MLEISLQFFPQGLITYIQDLVQVMARRLVGTSDG